MLMCAEVKVRKGPLKPILANYTQKLRYIFDLIFCLRILELLYHCEIINLSGKSYRMENRKTIFNEAKTMSCPEIALHYKAI